MKPGPLIFALLAAALCARGQDAAPQPGPLPVPAPPARPGPPRAWLGFQVGKPDVTITAQLPDLPRGFGFIVRSVIPGGPAEAAGIREYDLVWKLGDQLLVNEGQLAALLRLRKPGEETRISFFRGGKPMEVSLTLGDTPKPDFSPMAVAADATLFPADRGPMSVVNFAQKLATYANEEGKAEVSKNDDGFHILITKTDGGILHEGALDGPEDFRKLPENWRRRAFALRRGLEQSLISPVSPPRQPRPRIAAPTTAK